MPAWSVHFNTTVRTGDPAIVKQDAEVHALAAVIRGIPIPPHVQQRLDQLNISRAVRGTTGIEGTGLSEEEVRLIIEAASDQPVLGGGRIREEQEVRNAHYLMEYVAQWLEKEPEFPITEVLIRTFHEILTYNIDYPRNVPGQYRDHPVSAGEYLPPRTGDEVRSLMTDFISWFNTNVPTTWDPVIRAIVAHIYVISIHPFGDGNGRTARAVESYLLYQAGVNARGYYSLANYYYSKRPEFVGMLDHVRFRSDPDLTPFVAFALTGLVEELKAVHDEVLEEVRVIAFRDFARETLSQQGKMGTPGGERQLYLLHELAEGPVSLRALRLGRHTLSAIYKSVTVKTLLRDINFFKQYDLVLIKGDKLEANLEIMTQVTAVNAPRSLLTEQTQLIV